MKNDILELYEREQWNLKFHFGSQKNQESTVELIPQIQYTFMEGAVKAIKAVDGKGIPTVKPWDVNTLKEKFKLVKESGAFAVAMDVDAAGLLFLKNLTPPAGSKTVAELADTMAMCGAHSLDEITRDMVR